jgi:outer membrane biosynthesis protein TonB
MIARPSHTAVCMLRGEPSTNSMPIIMRHKFWLQIATASLILALPPANTALAQEAEALPEITVEAPKEAPKQKKYPTPKVAKKPQSQASAPQSTPQPQSSPQSVAASTEPAPAPAPAEIPQIAVRGGVIGEGREGVKALK